MLSDANVSSPSQFAEYETLMELNNHNNIRNIGKYKKNIYYKYFHHYVHFTPLTGVIKQPLLNKRGAHFKSQNSDRQQGRPEVTLTIFLIGHLKC